MVTDHSVESVAYSEYRKTFGQRSSPGGIIRQATVPQLFGELTIPAMYMTIFQAKCTLRSLKALYQFTGFTIAEVAFK